MSVIPHTCRNCGTEFGFPLTDATHECPACGTMHGRPEGHGDGGSSLLQMANRQRAAGAFGPAESYYRQLLTQNPRAHEALWGLLMCKYGVEYVRDPMTQELRPTLHFCERTPITEDEDFVEACECAPAGMREQYQQDAEYIEQIQQQLINPGTPATPVDIFICYKATEADGRTPTREIQYAKDLYYNLRDTYDVFFAHESLQSVAAGANYEAKIFQSLYSAKVMLVVCSNPEHLETAWVRSEWRRFLGRVAKGEECCIIPLYFDGVNPYDMPKEFLRRNIQGVHMGDMNALDKLRTNLQAIIQKRRRRSAAPEAYDEEAMAEALMPVEYELIRGNWKGVRDLSGPLISKYPRCAQLYLYRLLATMKRSKVEDLRDVPVAFEESIDWQWAMRNATPEEAAAWTEILNGSLEYREQLKEARAKAEAEEAEAAERRKEQARLDAMEKQEREEAAARVAEKKREEVRAMLRAKKWQKAANGIEALEPHPDKHLLQLQIKHQLPTESALATAPAEVFEDELWKAALKACEENGARHEKLEKYQKESEAYWRRSGTQKEISRTILRVIFCLLGFGGVIIGTLLAQGWVLKQSSSDVSRLLYDVFQGDVFGTLSRELNVVIDYSKMLVGVVSYACVMVAYIVFCIAWVVRKKGGVFTSIVLFLVIVFVGLALCFVPVSFMNLHMMFAAYLALVMLAFSRTEHGCLKASQPMHIWLALYFGLPVLNGLIDVPAVNSVLGTIYGLMDSWIAVAAIALIALLAALSRRKD